MTRVVSKQGYVVDLNDAQRVTEWKERVTLEDGERILVDRAVLFVPEYPKDAYEVVGSTWKYVHLKADAKSTGGTFVLTAGLQSEPLSAVVLSREEAHRVFALHPPAYGPADEALRFFPESTVLGSHPSTVEEKAMLKAAEQAEELERLRKEVEELKSKQ